MQTKLGIDLGGKYVGLAVVKTPANEVLHACTIELRDDIKDKMDERRSLRRARRNRLWHREPRFDNRIIRVKCKYVDKETGEICNANTPKRSNIRHLLLENILTDLKVADEIKNEIRKGLGRDVKKNDYMTYLKILEINRYIKKQINDILFGKSEGRTVFCSKHIPLHHEQVTIEAESSWLSNSIRAKQDQIITYLQKIAKQFSIDEVTLERANFDLQKLQGTIDSPDDYMQGYNFGHRNRFEALKQEYGNRCCFCGKKGGEEVKLKTGHLHPKAKEEINRWENLITICEKCNIKQGERGVEEAGMKFAVIKEKVFNPVLGRAITVSRTLAPKPLSESKINKYMTHTDIGIRKLKTQIKSVFNNVPIKETFGYITSYYRNLWQLEKEHHNDAVVIASDKGDINKKPISTGIAPFEIKANIKGEKLFDTNPLQFKDGKFYQKISLIGRKERMRSTKHLSGQRNVRSYGTLRIDQIDDITSKSKQNILEDLRDKLGYKKGDRTKTFKPDEIINANLPFRTVTIVKLGVGQSSVRRIKNNLYRVASDVNEHIMVYSNSNGRLRAFPVKNKRVFKNSPFPEDYAHKLFTVRKGDVVCWKNRGNEVIGRVTKCLTKGPSIDIKDVNSDKVYTAKNPVYIQWVHSPDGKVLFENSN